MSSAGLPNPFLVAILLVCNTRTGSGAQLVYHYPPDPLAADNESFRSNSSYEADTDVSSTDTAELSSEEDELLDFSRGPRRPNSKWPNSRIRSASDDGGPRSDSQYDRTRLSPNHLLGFALDGLVGLLVPDRIWHKRRFELGINELTFVGRPVFVRQDGNWAKQRRSRPRRTKTEEPISDTVSESEDEAPARPVETDVEAEESPQNQSTRSQLTMFHVVFVLNPPPIDQNAKVKEMYDHVIKKLSRALRWEQVHNDYVWKQSEIIAATKASANAKRTTRSHLYADIAERSSLALAITSVYNAISNSRIASITLSPKVSFSLQIPPITSTATLPSLTDPPIQPGLWLTTATDLGSTASENDSVSMSAHQMAKHYTLLLKAPPQRITKDLQEAGGPLAQHLPRFISALRPTKSFYKLSVSSRISLTDVQTFAQHLIYWRRAVAIPPLHQRDTYIVSPNADMRKLRDAARSYESQFPPTMPSLPKMLSVLSGIPRPYRKLIPSSDHKEVYYLALAWLLRNGWVTQLRTFAFVCVNPSIKRQVRDADREARTRTSQSRAKETVSDGKESGRPGATRPRLTSYPSSDGRRSLDGSRAGSNTRMTSLILNPPRASSEESKWLDYIRNVLGSSPEELALELSEEDRADLRKYWPVLLKYLNGRVALETIPVRESLKRTFVSNLFEKVGLTIDRSLQTESKASNRALLLSIRHW